MRIGPDLRQVRPPLSTMVRMKRKTFTFSIALFAGAIGLNIATAESSVAMAQENQAVSIDPMVEIPLTEETVPVFVTKEMVQNIPVEPTPPTDHMDIEVAPAAASLRDLVAQTSTDGRLSDELQCLAGAIYFEARGEPLSGQLAVGQVIANRADDRRFPSSYCGVVYQRAQFSFIKNGTMPKPRTGSKAWRNAVAIARIVHNAHWESEAADALYFHAKYVKPRWANRKVARATISTHIFYK